MNSRLKKTILLVEDEVVTARAEARMIERFGYNVIHSYNGEEAVKAIFEKREIDLVLMDIDLGPGMDGTQAAEKILSIRDLPVVFFSAHTEKLYVDKVKKNHPLRIRYKRIPANSS